MNKAVFFDRDGVLNRAIMRNRKPYAPLKLKDLKIELGLNNKLNLLKESGYILVVVTNQPEISRGNLNLNDLALLHNELQDKLGELHFYVCPHDNFDNCNCRKPLPGLIFKAAENLNIDTSKSFLVGDRWKDIAAGNAANCQCIWIDHKYDETEPTGNFKKVSSIHEAINYILINNVGPKYM